MRKYAELRTDKIKNAPVVQHVRLTLSNKWNRLKLMKKYKCEKVQTALPRCILLPMLPDTYLAKVSLKVVKFPNFSTFSLITISD